MTGADDGDGPGRGDGAARSDDDSSPRLDVDTAFAAIVAGWASETDPPPRTWPDAEDVEAPRHRKDDALADRGGQGYGGEHGGPDRGGPDDEALVGARAGGPLLPSLGPDDDEPLAPRREEEGYVPPEPPPLPRGDLFSRLAWAGVIGGPVFLLIAALVWPDAHQLLVLLAVGAFVGGFLALVIRLPQHRSDDGDDGAVV